MRTWITNLRSYAVLAKLVLTSGLAGLAAGLTWPFFNVFFFDRHGALPFEFGLVFALTGGLTSVTTLLSPLFVKKIGRLNTIVFPALLALPFLAFLPLAPTFLLAGLIYLMRGVVDSVSGPVQGLFTMELVERQERGTVEGVLHAVNEFPMGVTARIAGPLLFLRPVSVAAEEHPWAMPVAYVAAIAFALILLVAVYLILLALRQRRQEEEQNAVGEE